MGDTSELQHAATDASALQNAACRRQAVSRWHTPSTSSTLPPLASRSQHPPRRARPSCAPAKAPPVKSTSKACKVNHTSKGSAPQNDLGEVPSLGEEPTASKVVAQGRDAGANCKGVGEQGRPQMQQLGKLRNHAGCPMREKQVKSLGKQVETSLKRKRRLGSEHRTALEPLSNHSRTWW